MPLLFRRMNVGTHVEKVSLSLEIVGSVDHLVLSNRVSGLLLDCIGLQNLLFDHTIVDVVL